MKGITMTAEFFKEGNKKKWRYNAFVLELLEYALSRNVFVFNGSHCKGP